MIYLLIFGPVVSFALILMLLGNFYAKAGHAGKEKIPFQNILVLFNIIERSPLWGILFFIPYINVILIIWLITEFLKAFNHREILAQVLGIFFGYIYLPYLNFTSKIVYVGDQPKERHSSSREWIDALIFAVVAATIIRTFIIEAYTIPTGSMEQTLLVGDFLFVSKFHYGPRIPNTPIAFPFAHNTMPLLGTKSYSDIIELPYYRLPKLQDIKRYDIVVFNWPGPDPNLRPVDKRDNYIKRCVGLPGDTIQVIDGVLFVNGKKAYTPEKMQFMYTVNTDGTVIDRDFFRKYDIEAREISRGTYMMFLTDANYELVKKLSNVNKVEKKVLKKGDIEEQRYYFPPDFEHFKWNVDNYGPLQVPSKGQTVQINPSNIKIYERIIGLYEGNKLTYKGGKIFINGQEATSYTFKMDYYWMMGDNRHNSEDSRFWGFVPEDHIVGKAWIIWLSLDSNEGISNKIRWSRLFKPIKGMP